MSLTNQQTSNSDSFFQQNLSSLAEGSLFDNQHFVNVKEDLKNISIVPQDTILLKNTPTLEKKSSEITNQRRKGGRITIKQMEESLKKINLPSKEVLAEKMYYPITEVASWFSVNSSLLRYWEKEFDFIKPRKNKKGDRFYTVDDIAKIELIFNLLRVKKFTIEGAKEFIRFAHKNQEHKNQVLTRLTKIKENLSQLKQKIE